MNERRCLMSDAESAFNAASAINCSLDDRLYDFPYNTIDTILHDVESAISHLKDAEVKLREVSHGDHEYRSSDERSISIEVENELNTELKTRKEVLHWLFDKQIFDTLAAAILQPIRGITRLQSQIESNPPGEETLRIMNQLPEAWAETISESCGARTADVRCVIKMSETLEKRSQVESQLSDLIFEAKECGFRAACEAAFRTLAEKSVD